MNIAELFINLGIKGSDKAVGALDSVKKGLGETASLSLEAKAGIVAAMYAMERLFASSGKTGTGLTNFNAATGTSIQTLQKYQYAARQMGASNEEVEGSFKSLQEAMTKIKLGQAPPAGMMQLAKMTGAISQADVSKFQEHPELLLQRLQQYAQKEKSIGLRNEVLKSFGVNGNMLAALSRNAFTPQALAKAPTYNDKEVGQLDKANIAWSNLGTKIEMAVGHFNAMHGGKLVTDISKIVDQVIHLTEAFIKLSETLHLFEGISKTFEVFTKLTEGGEKLIGAVGGNKKDQKSIFDAFKNIPEALKRNPFGSASDQATAQKALDSMGKNHLGFPSNVTPPMPNSPKMGANQNINVNQNLNFQHEGKDHQKTSHSVKKAIQDAYRQIPQGTGA